MRSTLRCLTGHLSPLRSFTRQNRPGVGSLLQFAMSEAKSQRPTHFCQRKFRHARLVSNERNRLVSSSRKKENPGLGGKTRVGVTAEGGAGGKSIFLSSPLAPNEP
jgi:hypothetical protein